MRDVVFDAARVGSYWKVRDSCSVRVLGCGSCGSGF